MKPKDILFEPQNDTGTHDSSIVAQNRSLLLQNRYSDATSLLNDNSFKKGFRASLFNLIQNKIRALEIYLLNEFAASPDELYSMTEPTEEQMADRKFWLQIYD
ncbi:MAG: hypothetical protein K2O06_18400 [Acetatifactor sp.]|nr:hypothetical protein [Acetatifactor sp.]